MNGIDVTNGQSVTGLAHLKQSITDILSTPIGSRVRRRNYGSRLPDLIDKPITENNIIEVYAATADALDKWEPRLTLTKVHAFLGDEVGKLVITLFGKVNNEDVQLEVVL